MCQNKTPQSRSNVIVYQIPHFIGGQRVDGSAERTADVMNPSLGKVQGTVNLATVDEVNHAIANAAEAQQGWAKTNPQKRIRVIMKWIALINENIDEIARTLFLEHGKTFEDARGGGVFRGYRGA